MPTFGVLGSGEVGQVLAKGLKAQGYGVRIGSRHPRLRRRRHFPGGLLSGG